MVIRIYYSIVQSYLSTLIIKRKLIFVCVWAMSTGSSMKNAPNDKMSAEVLVLYFTEARSARVHFGESFVKIGRGLDS